MMLVGFKKNYLVSSFVNMVVTLQFLVSLDSL